MMMFDYADLCIANTKVDELQSELAVARKQLQEAYKHIEQQDYVIHILRRQLEDTNGIPT